MSIQSPTCAHDPPRVDPRETYLGVLCRIHICMFFTRYVCFSKADKLLPVIGYRYRTARTISKRISRKRRVQVAFYGRSANNQ